MKNKVRGFELIDGLGGTLPVRSTLNSAGYDFFASEDVVIQRVANTEVYNPFEERIEDYLDTKPTLLKTGVKAYMQENEFLMLANRSSNPMKLKLILSNGVGIIDSDYYNNVDNEGHIMFQFFNIGDKDILIKKGDKIGQGIFLPYLLTDDDNVLNQKRTGGFGSSGK